MRLAAAALTATLILAAASTALAGDPRLAPLARSAATVVHGPFEQGSCDACHQRSDPSDPGKAATGMATCLACHDEFGGRAPVRVGKGRSHPIKGECVGCHNPHNSKKKKLLL